MKRNNTVTIRPCFSFVIYSLICAIIMLYATVYTKDIIYLVFSLCLFCICFLAYSFKILLDFSQLENNILIVSKYKKPYSFNVTNLDFIIFINIVILTDRNSIVYLEKSGKLIRELKKIGAMEKELK